MGRPPNPSDLPALEWESDKTWGAFHDSLVDFLTAYPRVKEKVSTWDLLSHLHRWKKCCNPYHHPLTMLRRSEENYAEEVRLRKELSHERAQEQNHHQAG